MGCSGESFPWEEDEFKKKKRPRERLLGVWQGKGRRQAWLSKTLQERHLRSTGYQWAQHLLGSQPLPVVP